MLFGGGGVSVLFGVFFITYFVSMSSCCLEREREREREREIVCWLVGCLTSKQHMQVYLRDGR